MGPIHNNQNGPGGPKKGGLVKITTPGCGEYEKVNTCVEFN